MAFQIKTRSAIVQDMIANYVADNQEVNDFVPGSAVRSILEAFASAMEELYTATHLGNRRAVRDIPSEVFGLTPKEGVQATVNLTFTKEAGLTEAVTIDAGTRVSDGAELVFQTRQSLVIASGDSSGTTSAIAENVGRKYNVASGVLTTLVDSPVGISMVNNAAAATGGEDSETEFDFNYRFNLYVEGLGRCNRAGLEAGALSVVGVTDASAVDLNPPVMNVNCNLYVDNNSSAGLSTAKVAEVKGIIDGDGTDENPGYRSSGVNVAVLSPTIVSQAIGITLTVARGYVAASMEDLVERRAAQFINRLRIGSNLLVAELLAVVMLIPGVVNAEITTPSADVAATVAQVVRAGTFTFSTTVQT